MYIRTLNFTSVVTATLCNELYSHKLFMSDAVISGSVLIKLVETIGSCRKKGNQVACYTKVCELLIEIARLDFQLMFISAIHSSGLLFRGVRNVDFSNLQKGSRVVWWQVPLIILRVFNEVWLAYIKRFSNMMCCCEKKLDKFKYLKEREEHLYFITCAV